MVRRSSVEDFALANNRQDKFTTSNAAGLSSSNEQRRKSSYQHRYRTLKAKVKDVVGSAYGSSTEVSPTSVVSGRLHSKTLPPNSRPYVDPSDGCEASIDSRQPSPSLRSEESPTLTERVQDTSDDTVDDEGDLTDPAEWRKFIDSVKKEVAGRPVSIQPDPGSTRRVGALSLSTQDNSEELRAGLRAPAAIRRLLACNNRGDSPGDDDEDYRGLSRSPPMKRSLSPSKFLRRSDASQSTSTSDERADAFTNKSRFRLPRFPSPSRRSPYSQLAKPVRDLPSQDSGEKKDCAVIPDFSGISSDIQQDVEKVVLPHPQSPEALEMTTEPEANATPTKKGRKVNRKKSKSPPVAKPIPAEIQELNEQVLKAVGSAQHRLDDDDTTGDATRSNAGTNAFGDSIDQDDLLSHINISTTSGIQVKGDKEKEEMLHQTIARRVLSVLIRPTAHEASSRLAAAETNNGTKAAIAAEVSTKKKVGLPSDDDFTDAADEERYHDGESTTMGLAAAATAVATAGAAEVALQESATASAPKIREQLMALKAKTEHQEQLKTLKARPEHVSLRKTLEKSRKSRVSGRKTKSNSNTTTNKKAKSKTNKRSSSTKRSSNRRQTDVEKASSYESFDDSFASKADAATCCFISSLLCCCADSSKSADKLASEDEKTIYSETSLDTYESGWGGGRPLPILSPSDFSAEKDDLFDVVEKSICGAV